MCVQHDSGETHPWRDAKRQVQQGRQCSKEQPAQGFRKEQEEVDLEGLVVAGILVI